MTPEYQNLLTKLSNFKNVVVSGPQRSGTTFIANCLSNDLGYKLFLEESFSVHDIEVFNDLRIQTGNKVIQCPALSSYLDMMSQKDTIVVFCVRKISDIIKSEERIAWQRNVYKINSSLFSEREYEKLKYLIKIEKGKLDYEIDFSKPICEIKYDFWFNYQKKYILNNLEVQYESFKLYCPKSWVDKTNRKAFFSRQTIPVANKRKTPLTKIEYKDTRYVLEDNNKLLGKLIGNKDQIIDAISKVLKLEEGRTSDRNEFWSKLENYQNSLSEMNDKVVRLEENILSDRNELSNKEEELKKLNENIKSLRLIVKELRDELHSQKTINETIDIKLHNVTNQLEESKKTSDFHKKELQIANNLSKDLSSSILNQSLIIAEKERYIITLKDQNDSLNTIINGLNEEGEKQVSIISDLHQRVKELEVSNFNGKTELEILEIQNQDIKKSLSYRIGRFFTYPARLLYDNIYIKLKVSVPFTILRLIMFGLSKPFKFFSKFNRHNIRVLNNALRTENPKQILINFANFLNQDNLKKSKVSLNVNAHAQTDIPIVKDLETTVFRTGESLFNFPSLTIFKVLFINNLDLEFDSSRYRVDSIIKALKLVNVESDCQNENDVVNNISQVFHYDLIVFFRVGWSPRIELILESCKKYNIVTIYDIDDYVFEPAIANTRFVSGLQGWDESRIKQYKKGVEDYRKVLLACDFATTSTNYLKDKIIDLGITSFLIRNSIPDGLVRINSSNRDFLMRDNHKKIELVYMSGSNTHQKDFGVLYKPLVRILEKYKKVCLFIFGYLDLSEFPNLEKYSGRIRKQSRVPWYEMYSYLGDSNINLAPLEIGNPFCEGKSELKYIEGSMYGLATVASATSTFKEVIKTGVNGYLCSSEDDWFKSLATLIENKELRQTICRNSLQDVLLKYSPICLAESAHFAYSKAIKDFRFRMNIKSNQLRISWLVPMPVAGSGGHNDIFIAANCMVKRGHDTSIYFVDADSENSPSEIKNFISENFGYNPLFRIITGVGIIKSCDALIATHHTTAYLVDKNRSRTNLPTYFVQDYEPFFNPVGSEYFEAEMTYRLNLFAICLGPWLANTLNASFGHRKRTVDFWVNRKIYFPTIKRQFRNEAEGKNLIFFARPSMPRRAFNMGIRALSNLYKKDPSIKISLFGSNEPVEKYIDFPFKNLKVLSREQLVDLYNKADIGLIFSTTNPSLLIFEAMACGLPVIDLDVNDTKERHNQYPAFIVKPRIDDIMNGIIYLFENPLIREELSNKSIDFTQSLPSIDEALSSVSTLIEEELNGRIFK